MSLDNHDWDSHNGERGASERRGGRASKRRRIHGAGLWYAFKDVAILFSFVVNFILVIVVLLLVGWGVFPAKTDIAEPMLDNLQEAIDALENATIVRTIPINQQVPVSFTVPLQTETMVVLSQDVDLVRPASFVWPSGGGQINGTVFMSLPAGMELPVVLDLDVPVDNAIPVQFPVEVSIPLRETELNQVVIELNDVIGPVRQMLEEWPDGF